MTADGSRDELLALALDGIAAAWESDSESAFARSRRLREAGEDADDYELGYAEGRHSALGRAAQDLRKVSEAIRRV